MAKTTKEKIDYTVGLPTKPEPAVYDYLVKKGAFKVEVLIYKAAWITNPLTGLREQVCEVRCSACGAVAYLPRVFPKDKNCGRGPDFGYFDEEYKTEVYSGMDALCPCCGAGAKVHHSSEIGRYYKRIDGTQVLTVHVVCGRLCLLSWYYGIDVDKEAKKHIEIFKQNGYIVDGKKVMRVAGYYSYFYNQYPTEKWENRCRFEDLVGEPDEVFPFDSKLIEASNVPNCKLDLYVKSEGCRPIAYMNIYVKRPNVENLIVQGYGALFNDCLKLHSYYSTATYLDKEMINLKAAKPHEMLGLTKDEIRFLRGKNMLNAENLRFWKKVRDRLSFKEFTEAAQAVTIYEYEYLVERKKLPLMKTIRYIGRQKLKADKAQQRLIGVQYYLDYLDLAKKNGDDIKDASVLYPQHLINAHDYQVHRQEYKESEKLKNGFSERAILLSEYEFTDSELGFLIRPASCEKELHDEGKILHHCVATYAKRHAEGKTDIFFIRKLEAPDSPYFTLELSESDRQRGKVTVLQNRGLYNCARTDEVTAFEEKWKEHILQILIKKQGEKEKWKKQEK